jgi:hypothetical protein
MIRQRTNNSMETKYKTLEEAQAHNISTIKTYAEKLGISYFQSAFDGCGDSGQIESTIAYDKDSNEISLDGVDVEGDLITRWYRDGEHYLNTHRKPMSFHDLVEEFIWNKLEENHGGWEINEGSYGLIRLNSDCTGSIEYNERVIEVNESSSSF